MKLINLTLETNENKRPTVYDLLLKLPRDFHDKNETNVKEEKKDINLLQDVYIPKSSDDFNSILTKFYNAEKGNKIDISKYLIVKKYT